MRTSSAHARSGISDLSIVGAVLLLCGLLAACVTPPATRHAAAVQLARSAGWQATTLHVGRFEVLSLHPEPSPTEEIAVFIEGDGLAWLNVTTPSPDPTPVTPVALQMALAEPHRLAVYLGRPCQYMPEQLASRCTREDWTAGRFSAEIVTAMNQAVDQLKARFQAQRVRLVGYSGGGAIATLLAARRQDVTQLVTVASVLDHVGWTQSQHLSPLRASLNPADAWETLRTTPQIHFIGAQDEVVGMTGLSGYLRRFPADQQPRVMQIDEHSHLCCWASAWKSLSPR